MKALPPILFLVGATATGKSEAALAWARENRGAILSMDAMQVYRGADIGTGKPSRAEREEIPHGGLDLVEVGSSFSVAAYLDAAGAFLREQAEAARGVIIVGGTGLYFRALTRGLCLAPPASELLHGELQALSVVELRERLRRSDAPMLEKIDAANPRRLIRAIEVMETTGRSLLQWQAETPEPLVPSFTAYWLRRGKAELESRIERRVEAMLAGGWEEEVKELVRRHGLPAVERFSAIGYREIARAGGDVSSRRGIPRQARDDRVFDEMANAGGGLTAARDSGGYLGVGKEIVTLTRQYAKRQLTWFAREPNLQDVMASGHEIVSLASL